MNDDERTFPNFKVALRQLLQNNDECLINWNTKFGTKLYKARKIDDDIVFHGPPDMLQNMRRNCLALIEVKVFGTPDRIIDLTRRNDNQFLLISDKYDHQSINGIRSS